MKKLNKITMLLAALAFTTTACNNSDNEPGYGEITLTTPVVSLGGIEATASRAEKAEFTDMVLHVDLLNKEGESNDRSCTFKYGSGEWSHGSDQSLIVTAGEGKYYARAIAERVNVKQNNNVLIEGAFYVYNGENNSVGTIDVKDKGTFTFGAEMKPLTAAIKVVLKDADGEPVNSGYTVTMNGLQHVNLNGHPGAKWEKDGKSVKLDARKIKEPIDDFNKVYGNYVVDTYPAGTIMTITNSVEEVTYHVTTTSDLTLEAGKLYTFNVKLGGDTTIEITSNGITVTDFVIVNGTIEIKR